MKTYVFATGMVAFIMAAFLCSTPVMGKKAQGLQVITIEGSFLDSASGEVEEYDYLEPDRRYRLLPETKIQFSTLDGKKNYVAVGPGVLFLDGSGSVLLNGKALNPKVQQSLFQDVTLSKVPSHNIAGLRLRGSPVVIIMPEGKRISLYRNSYALVVGNGNYTHGWDPLPGAIRDVKDVAKALEQNGFDVTLKTDLAKEDFSKAFWKFCYKNGKSQNNRLLFYYAGHGYTQEMATGEDLGYLVMVDAPVPEKDPMGFDLASVDMQAIVTQAKMIKARHVLFMFDSCFSGSILNLRERVVPESISESVRLPVRQFITAGRANEPVPDHSIFKQAFLDLLEGRDKEPIPDGYITGEELGLYLKNKVPEYNPRQHPQYGRIKEIRLDKGDFVFVLKNQHMASASNDRLREEQELERLKGEMKKKTLQTERKHPEAEKKKPDMGKLSPKPKQNPTVSAVSINREILRDGRFIAYSNGTVLDTETNLMWAAADTEVGHHSNSRVYCEKYRGGGYGDWRMPTLDELETLYDEKFSNRHGYHISELIEVSGDYIWALQNRWGGEAAFNFQLGSPTSDGAYVSGNPSIFRSIDVRTLPVRGGN